MQMQIQLLETKSIDDLHYIDVMLVNGELFTFLMEKIEEPNVFGVKKRENGNTINTINMETI